MLGAVWSLGGTGAGHAATCNPTPLTRTSPDPSLRGLSSNWARVGPLWMGYTHAHAGFAALPSGQKIAWWRAKGSAFGKLRVTGTRLDSEAPPLRARISKGYTQTRGFQPSVLFFPTPGCWRIVARVGLKQRYVFRVVVSSPAVFHQPSPPDAFVPPGDEGCRPASPARPWGRGLVESRGSGDGVELWALVFDGAWADARTAVVAGAVGRQIKIAWRMTGGGPLSLVATRGDGRTVVPIQEPTPHGGSSWDRPGDEWGSTFVFPEPGCWRIEASRGSSVAELWLRIAG